MAQTQTDDINDDPDTGSASRSINPFILVLLVIAIAVCGGAMVQRLIVAQQERELLSWQTRLNLIADSRAADVEAWLDIHFRELANVASNPSLQLYLNELVHEKNENEAPPENSAQVVFLRDLLSFTADRLGFIEPQSAELSSVKADVKGPSGVGIAIVDNSGKILVSIAGLPVLDPDLAQKVEQAPKGRQTLIDIYKTASGDRRIGFVLPIFPIDSNPTVSQETGRLVGVMNVSHGLFKLLRHPGATEPSLEAVLLRKDGTNVDYLSPYNTNGDPNAPTRLALDTPGLDAAYAVSSPGSFAVMQDAVGHQTLMTSRPIGHSPWVLMEHIYRDQALGESDAWLRQIKYSLLFALLSLIGCILAVWYYSASQKAELASHEIQQMAIEFAAKEKLLKVIADNQLEPIIIADQNNVARFANAKAARILHMKALDVLGKDLSSLMGSSLAKGYEEGNKIALEQAVPYVRMWVSENNSVTRFMRSEHVPLAHIPVKGLPFSQGVMVIDQDVTEIVNEREHGARVLRQLVDTLVHMVDRRNPHAAKHSACVALIAHAAAWGMGLEHNLVETAETAGKLMNIGKIVVPSRVLVKTAPLTKGETRALRESLQSGIALLETIEFTGPVVDTLRQSQEHYDGTGPLGLKGDDILVTARIIAAANAFVGMIGTRSYRDALSIDEAIKTLLSLVDTRFDRRVVIAIVDFIENKQGKEAIESLISTETSIKD